MSEPDFYVELYKGKKQGRQVWRWRARDWKNYQNMASSGESYANKSDCLDAVTDLFSAGSTVHLVDGVTGSQEVLREGVPPMDPCEYCGHHPVTHTDGCTENDCGCWLTAKVEWTG